MDILCAEVVISNPFGLQEGEGVQHRLHKLLDLELGEVPVGVVSRLQYIR